MTRAADSASPTPRTEALLQSSTVKDIKRGWKDALILHAFQLERELTEAQRDAERYRYMRSIASQGSGEYELPFLFDGLDWGAHYLCDDMRTSRSCAETLDRAIDAEIAKGAK